MKTILSNGNLFRLSVIFLGCLPALGFECPNSVLLFNAVGQDFAAQRNIKAEDLGVTVDGKRTPIISFSLSSGPRRVVLIVDASSSMHPPDQKKGRGTISLLTATFAAESAPEGSPVAMITVSDEPKQESNNFETREQVEKRIRDLAKTEPQGHTALFDSVDQALSLLGTPQPGDAIYLVSDGEDNHSHVSFSELKVKLVSQGVRVFVFPMSVEKFTTPEEHYGEESMEELAEFTGGIVIRVPWSDIKGNEQAWLEKSASQIREQVQAMCEVKLDNTAATRQGKKVKIVVNQSVKGRSTLAYPRLLVECPSRP